MSSDEIIRSTHHLFILFVYLVCLLQMICKVHCPKNLAFELYGNSVVSASPVTPITKAVYKLWHYTLQVMKLPQWTIAQQCLMTVKPWWIFHKLSLSHWIYPDSIWSQNTARSKGLCIALTWWHGIYEMSAMHLEFCARSIVYGRLHPKRVSYFSLEVQTKGNGGKFESQMKSS